MSNQLASPVTITPSGGTWASYTVAGLQADTTAVWGYIVRTNTGNVELGVRTPGVTTDFRWLTIGQYVGFFVAGVNASDQIEVFGNDYTVRVFGELNASDGVAPTGALPTLTHVLAGTWQTNDFASISGANTAIAAVLLLNQLDGVTFRQTGSTDDRYPNQCLSGQRVVGLNASEQFDSKIVGGGVTLYVPYYFLGAITWNTNALDRSLGTTGAYTDLTALPVGAFAGIYDVVGVTTGDTVGLRTNGSSLTDEVAFRKHTQIAVTADAGRLIEGRISTTDVDFWLQGTISASFPTVNVPASMAHGDSVNASTGNAPLSSRSLSLSSGAVTVVQSQLSGSTDSSLLFTANFERVFPLTSIRRGATATASLFNSITSFTGTDTFTTASPAGQTHVDVASLNDVSANRITAIPDIAIGDQLQFRGVGNTALPAGFFASTDATIGFISGATVANVEARLFRQSDSTLSEWALQTLVAPPPGGGGGGGTGNAPSVPTGLNAVALNGLSVSLYWNASTDPNDDLAGYRIYRNGVSVATTTATAFLDISLPAVGFYTYSITAFDEAGNESAQSFALLINTSTVAVPLMPVILSDPNGEFTRRRRR